MRFGWLEQPFTTLEQLDSLFEIHSLESLHLQIAFMLMKMAAISFFEEVDDQHPVGFLSVLEVFKDGTYTPPESILKLDYHLSYPCVFKVDHTWYMIPETSANKTIELWKCTEFPLKWEKHSNLIENIEAVDSTPFTMRAYGIFYLNAS